MQQLTSIVPEVGLIGVLMGGVSSEKDVSLRSGSAVVTALAKIGLKAIPLDIQSEDPHAIAQQISAAKIQFAFLALHGRIGEDGTVQSILEEMKIPYTGSGVRASACAFNKVTTQRTLRTHGLPVADFYVAHHLTADVDAIMEQFKQFPVVVKPACEGSSIGVSLVRSRDDFATALYEAFKYGNEILVERFIDGRELTVGILDREPLPIVEICSQNNFFDFTSKYQQGLTRYIVPAVLDENISKQVSEIALKAHQTLGCEGYSRVDFRLSHDLKPYILEINTIPGFTQTSLFPKAARQAGIEFEEVCLRLIHLAYGKKK